MKILSLFMTGRADHFQMKPDKWLGRGTLGDSNFVERDPESEFPKIKIKRKDEPGEHYPARLRDPNLCPCRPQEGQFGSLSGCCHRCVPVSLGQPF